jgi:hypothetical protein
MTRGFITAVQNQHVHAERLNCLIGTIGALFKGRPPLR